MSDRQPFPQRTPDFALATKGAVLGQEWGLPVQIQRERIVTSRIDLPLQPQITQRRFNRQMINL